MSLEVNEEYSFTYSDWFFCGPLSFSFSVINCTLLPSLMHKQPTSLLNTLSTTRVPLFRIIYVSFISLISLRRNEKDIYSKSQERTQIFLRQYITLSVGKTKFKYLIDSVSLNRHTHGTLLKFIQPVDMDPGLGTAPSVLFHMYHEVGR